MERNLSACYCLLALALIISTASLVLSIIVISKPNVLKRDTNSDLSPTPERPSDPGSIPGGETPTGTQNSQYSDDRVYVFAYDVPWEQYQYVTVDGELKGLSLDIIDAVCAEARKSCQHIIVPIEYCWNSEKGIGTGLLGKWFDSCAVFLKTARRDNIFRFSGSFYRPKRGQFYTKSERSIDLSQMGGLSIGVRSNWYISPECLMRIGIIPAQFKKAANPDELKNMLLNNTVDAVFAEESQLDSEQLLISDSNLYECALGGSGVMHRVDSDIASWFNPAFDKIKRRGVFGDLCKRYDSVKDSCLL